MITLIMIMMYVLEVWFFNTLIQLIPWYLDVLEFPLFPMKTSFLWPPKMLRNSRPIFGKFAALIRIFNVRQHGFLCGIFEPGRELRWLNIDSNGVMTDPTSGHGIALRKVAFLSMHTQVGLQFDFVVFRQQNIESVLISRYLPPEAVSVRR